MFRQVLSSAQELLLGEGRKAMRCFISSTGHEARHAGSLSLCSTDIVFLAGGWLLH